MVSYGKPSTILFIASAISARVASAHRIPDDFDSEKFAAELKELRVSAGQVTPENFLDGNEFIAPSGKDSRGPCPFINVMANHGYINRSGRNVPVFDIPALGPVLFDFPKTMFTRPANQAIFDGQVDVGSMGDLLLDLERLWDRPGEERDISQVFPNPGVALRTEFLTLPPDSEFPQENVEGFVDFRYTVDDGLLFELLSLSEDGETMTQEQHNTHLHNRLEDSLANDEFFRLSPDDMEVAATQYVLPCIILGTGVDDFSFCDRSAIEGLWRQFRLPDDFAPRSVRFGDAFDMTAYTTAFSGFMEDNIHDIEVILEEHLEEKEEENPPAVKKSAM